MTPIQLLEKAAGLPAGVLIALLRTLASAQPAFAAQVESIIAKIEAAIPLDNLVAVAEALPAELANIAQGKIDPRDHPSDAA